MKMPADTYSIATSMNDLVDKRFLSYVEEASVDEIVTHVPKALHIFHNGIMLYQTHSNFFITDLC